jgi:hypothetical protein
MNKTRSGRARQGAAVPATESTVFCRRLERKLPVREHLACPYCDGREADVRSADHARFCDFEKGRDPIVFGFPDTHGRHRQE